MKKITVFDFDGTLSSPDTNYEFWQFAMRRSVRPWIFLPAALFGLTLKPFSPNGVFWREMTRLYISKNLLKKLKKDFIKHHLQNRFGWSAEQVAAEKAAGNYVVCITASSDYFLPDLVKDMKFDLVLCSEMDKNKPWKFKFFCYGENKVKKLNDKIKSYKIIRSYSDSKSDLPLMRIAREEVWIDPKTGCRIPS